jgi:hypothetical protein
VVGAVGGVPLRVEYRVLTDGAGLTTAAHVRELRGFEQRAWTIERSAKGAWSVNGKPERALRACTDVDLGFSPSTNTLPIRRLRLGIGASQTIQAAWLRFPEMTLAKVAQSYSRVDEFTYRYQSGTFSAELVVDGDSLIASYEGGWRRTGVAIGPDETEPLNSQR